MTAEASMRQVILDTETTGLDPNEGHRIVEFGAVEVNKRRLTGNNLHHYVNPGRDSDPEALAVHGLSTEFLSEYPPLDRKSTRLNSSHVAISYAVFCLKKQTDND